MISIGIGAIIFSIWLVILFFGKNIGLSMLLFVIPFTYFFIYILEKNNKIKNPKYKLLFIQISLLSSTYLIFDNRFFNGLNLIIIPVMQSILVLGLLGENFAINFKAVGTIMGSFFSPLSFIRESTMKFVDKIKENLKIDVKLKNEEKIKRILKGILITLPIVLIITILLATADEIFANIFKDIFNKILYLLNGINISISVVKIICIVIAFFYFMGLFYYICIKYEVLEQKAILQTKINDNFTIKMILVSLNIIYLVFCYIQIKSLFMRNTTLNYAQYARQGFFQLMIVSIINLVTILIAKKRENIDENKVNKFINYMSLIMIIFTFIIVISAGIRMHFYENAYGYTLLRLLVYCTLITESIMFIPTVLYILDKKVNLSKSYFTIIVVMYLCMNFANFDNIIAKRNVDRYIETGKIDLYYLERETGLDSIKQILRILETKTNTDNVKFEATEYLKEEYEILNESNMDFRDFNLSRIFAKNLLEKKIRLIDENSILKYNMLNEKNIIDKFFEPDYSKNSKIRNYIENIINK